MPKSPTANGILGRKTHNIGASSDGAVQSSAPESKDSQTPSLTGTPTSAWKGVNDTPTTRQAVKRINEAGERYGVSLLSASLRWLAYHSRLDSSDAIVLGASSWRDLEERVEELAKGPLPDGLVATMDEVGEFLGFSRTLH
jgi:aryl-alcohol dehydrogenase-like predicted oxidoreductase